MIFLTVGTQFPFDRLVKAIDDSIAAGIIDEEVIAQVGDTPYKPRNFKAVASFEKKAFDTYLKNASCVISHAGMGTIIMALDHDKPLLVMPRSKKYDEVVNDHQASIARKFSDLGHILAVYDVKDLPNGIRKLKNFVPQERKSNPDAVVERIARFLRTLIA